MKRIWWYTRATFLMASLYFLLGFGISPQVSYAIEGCNASQTCDYSILTQTCTCPPPGAVNCDSCLMQSGVPGCGNCHQDIEGS